VGEGDGVWASARIMAWAPHGKTADDWGGGGVHVPRNRYPLGPRCAAVAVLGDCIPAIAAPRHARLERHQEARPWSATLRRRWLRLSGQDVPARGIPAGEAARGLLRDSGCGFSYRRLATAQRLRGRGFPAGPSAPIAVHRRCGAAAAAAVSSSPFCVSVPAPAPARLLLPLGFPTKPAAARNTPDAKVYNLGMLKCTISGC
jgi:hypothetical protein